MGGPQLETSRSISVVAVQDWTARSRPKGQILVVENESVLRESLAALLSDNGYEVSVADDGLEALRWLRSQPPPKLILLDLKMPGMDGWEFRTIQKDDPKLGLIPVLVVSGDVSPQAAAISADGHVRKPFDSEEVMTAIARVLSENESRVSARQDETERLASLGRVAANVGHEINNPLTFVILNLQQSLVELRVSLRALRLSTGGGIPEAELQQVRAHIVSVTGMLQECEAGTERIRGTVTNLQQLSHKPVHRDALLDVQPLIEESASMASNQIRHRARLTRHFGEAEPVRGNRTALGQVFLNLLVNAAQAIPEGNAEANEIRITTWRAAGTNGPELVVEVRDSGTGMTPEVASRVFEPYFTTKAMGEGTGLGLSISRQTIKDHGGRLTVESKLGEGTAFRVFLPVDRSVVSPAPPAVPESPAPSRRGRVLVIDDEPPIGRVIHKGLKNDHDVVVLQHASDALTRLEQGETFDVVLCDLVMPEVSGPEFYATLADRWPQLLPRVVFMTGGAFTPRTAEFMKRTPTPILAKPFALDELRHLVRERMAKSPNE